MTITFDTTLAIPNNGIRARNEWVLWQPGGQRGSDLNMPGVNGDLARRRFLRTTVRTLELVISGTVPVSGAATDPFEILEVNVEWMRDLVYPQTGDGTRDCVVTLASGDTFEGPVHLVAFDLVQVDQQAKWAFGALDVSIPGGELARVAAP